jgi:hypothetical protein
LAALEYPLAELPIRVILALGLRGGARSGLMGVLYDFSLPLLAAFSVAIQLPGVVLIVALTRQETTAVKMEQT